jgi:hypothetical protein
MKKLPFINSIPLSYIQSILKIDPLSPSGLTWLPRQDIKFKFLNNHAGCIHTDAKTGYQRWNTSVVYNSKRYYLICSRIIFLLHHGYLTKGKCIDHEDNNPLNNKIENLRESTDSQNAQNSKLRKDNTSGTKGLSWDKKKQKWVAEVYVNSKKIYIGCFLESEKENAKKAIEKARKKYHGDFGRTK